jgi:hypothetical protein
MQYDFFYHVYEHYVMLDEDQEFYDAEVTQRRFSELKGVKV